MHAPLKNNVCVNNRNYVMSQINCINTVSAIHFLWNACSICTAYNEYESRGLYIEQYSRSFEFILTQCMHRGLRVLSFRNPPCATTILSIQIHCSLLYSAHCNCHPFILTQCVAPIGLYRKAPIWVTVHCSLLVRCQQNDNLVDRV